MRCFQCHSTGTLKVAQRTVQPFELGVRCESCHGPGSDHAAKPSKANIRNPASGTSAEINDLCGQCHRMPPAAGSATNWTNAWNVRHQPVYLSRSRCFLESGGKLSCLTCHQPHQDKVSTSICATCHASVKHTRPIANRPCGSCHMPKVQPQPYLAFSNHWIGIYKPGSPLQPLSKRGSLTPSPSIIEKPR